MHRRRRSPTSKRRFISRCDSDGRGARRLTLPILLPDGREGSTDLIPAQSASPPSRDRLAGNWAPAQDGVCRIHAEWKFPGGKPSLVLWQELADCSKSGPPAFKTILDQALKAPAAIDRR